MSEFEEMIINSMRIESKNQMDIPECNELLKFLHAFYPMTGRVDIMFCNAFLKEATQLLINSIFLYKDGYFDSAFYSIRQAGEVMNSMLFLSLSDSKEFKDWSEKKYFPMDNKLKAKLEKMSCNYKEIKSLLPEYFSHYEELIKKTHKIIHKQGFDTFYFARKQPPQQYGFIQEHETGLFIETLKYTVGICLIIFIILEPFSLALSDEEVTYKINMDLMTEPLDIDYFERFLGLNDVIERIKTSQFYKDFISSFEDKEEMSMATYGVVREEYWNVKELDEIEKQINLLSLYEKIMFHILKNGIKVTNFYLYGGLCWYLTSIKSNFDRYSFNSEEFKKYLNAENKYNQSRYNVYISVINMYDEPLYFEHNEPLTNKEVEFLKALEEDNLRDIEKFYSLIESLSSTNQKS